MQRLAVEVSVLLIICVLVVLPTMAGDRYIGTASIFELGVSARTIGLGGAFIGVADDEAAIFYNPAGLASLSKTRFSSLYVRPFGAYSYAAVGVSEHGWGGYMLVLDSDTLNERDLYGNVTGSFRYTSSGLLFGFGKRIDSKLSCGLQVKGYRLFFPTSACGVAVSPSILYRQGALTSGIIWRNALSMGTYYADGHSEPWIRDIAVGLSYQHEDTTCCIDFTENLITRGEIACVRMGCEYSGCKPFVFRVGTNRDWSSLGFSFHWENLQLDFAYLIHYALADSYMISLSYQGTGSLVTELSKTVQWLGSIVRATN